MLGLVYNWDIFFSLDNVDNMFLLQICPIVTAMIPV